MALPVVIPNTFANATASIPLSQLDTNFTTLSNAVNGISDGSETLANLAATTVTVTNNISAAKFVPTGNVTAGNGMYLPAANTVAIGTNGTAAITINSSQNVGIGTSSPGEKLEVNGRVKVANSISVGNATPTTSGAGITFPATQSASTNANTLDDYEEGTFTATVQGTWSTSPTNLDGRYIKIGNMVFIRLAIVGGAKASSLAGWLQGLPFPVANDGTAAVVDADVVARGSVLFDNDDRIWFTNNSFSVGQNRFTGAYLIA